MTNFDSFNADKATVVKEQICCAINLLFEQKFPISAHTLSASAFSILKDLCEKNKKSKSYNKLINEIEQDPNLTRKTFFNLTNKAHNFFKHADKDADATLNDIKEESSETLLLLSCLFYYELGYEPTLEMRAFIYWTHLSYPEQTNRSKLSLTEKEELNKLLKDQTEFHLKERTDRLAYGKKLISTLKNQQC